MKDPNTHHPRRGLYYIWNWIGLTGLAIIIGSLFAFLLLFAIDTFLPTGNPYMGILIYFVSPVTLMVGFIFIWIGFLIQRYRLKKAAPDAYRASFVVDFTEARNRRRMGYFLGLMLFLLLFTAVGTYHSYHFTESVHFCGKSCHKVMKPEFTTYEHSPHARVSCSECHIGSGAAWYVKAKISGLRQVHATIFDKYERPIKTPIKNLRPAQETCERCHWPQKFAGNMDRTYTHFLTDEENSQFTVRLLLKVGGGDPTHGPVGGIHWHMNVANKVEYIATDEERQVIPWVRMINPQGIVTEFRVPDFTDDHKKHVIRTMDCMDCHNRPSHVFNTPNDAVNLALELGRLDTKMPSIKSVAVELLTRDYQTETDGIQTIATELNAKYPNDPRLKSTIDELQYIFRNNFFPEMKVSWKVYPDNIGHKDWPGCFRCHDGQHVTPDGKQTIKANDCNACHVILAQGKGEELLQLNPAGETFAHPNPASEGTDPDCCMCHSGAW